MYRLTCDGLPLLDWRDNDLVLVDPKVRLEVNKVGEGSFTIYKNHPHYGSLKKLKSVFEVSDDSGVIFRGRATGDTVDLDHGMSVDLEGAMAYFNDSVVRSFNFPDDFQVEGDRVAFFLGWLIDNHNSQVQDFQKIKLGNVTVKDPNFARSTYKHASTWEILKEKLFDSSLGGYLCIRYEEDGNYIDYLSEFTETNSQEIVFGENLLDLKNETEASETYSAIIPLGALELTIENLEDGDITDDIVKSGDTLYSKKAVEAYGWIYAPISATTWDEVTDESELLTVGVEWLTGSGLPLNGLEATAVDLHFTDEQVESLRIYKNVNVRSGPHEVAESFPLAKLEIELLKPQKTKVTVGKTIKTLTERTALQQEEAKKQYSKMSKTDDEIRLEVKDEVERLESVMSLTAEGIRAEVADEMAEQSASFEVAIDSIQAQVTETDEKYTSISQSVDDVTAQVVDNTKDLSLTLRIGPDGLTITNAEGNTVEIDGKQLKANSVLADLITAGVLQSSDGETFKLDLDNGTFSMKGSGQFQSSDGKTYIEIEGDEMVMYALDEKSGTYVDKIHFGFITGSNPADSESTLDYPYMLLGKSGGNVGMIKEFYNGLWVGNSVPKNASGNFEGMAGASGFFINTRTGISYVVNGTEMKDVYAGAEGEMTLTSEVIEHDGDKLSDRMPVCLTQAEYDALIAAGTYNEDTPYLIKKE